MAGPVLTQSLTVLFRNFDSAFPDRDHATDGWIGDAAHQQTTSGHNPDDTPGVKAEYSDADTKPEVRAIDVDKDLRYPGTTMQDVVDRILKTSNDTKRLMYIIYNRVIWSRSNNWNPRTYTGASPHTEHAHFSGDPVFDEDGSAWSVAQMGAGTVSVADVRTGIAQMADEGAQRNTPTGRAYADDFNVMVSAALADEFKKINDMLATLDTKLDLALVKLNDIQAKLEQVAPAPGPGPAVTYVFQGTAVPQA